MRIENAVVIIWDEITDGAEQFHNTFYNASDNSDLTLDRAQPAQELVDDITRKLFGPTQKPWQATGSVEINDATFVTTKEADRGYRGTVQIIWLGAAE